MSERMREGTPERASDPITRATARRGIWVSVCAAICASVYAAVLAAAPSLASSPAGHGHGLMGSGNGDIERGKYLVGEVAKCGECHTPRDAEGQLEGARLLQGAAIWITPVHPDPNWAERAPVIAGFPGYSDEDGINILERGIGANGKAIRPPMHIYHMKHEDAVAIIAYLRSLQSSPQ
jgi:mono/diheme cytochrome c family protein